MIEKIYGFTQTNDKTIEKIVFEKDLQLNHVILPSGERLPEHSSNANVHLILIRGEVTVAFNDQEKTVYKNGQIINVPENTKMNVLNESDQVLEFFIIKAPAPL